MRRLISFITVIAVIFGALSMIYADGFTGRVEYYVNGTQSETIKSGDVSVMVYHSNVPSGSTLIGAIYEDNRLFAIKEESPSGVSTELEFGELTITEGKKYTFKSIYLADTGNLTLATPAPTPTPTPTPVPTPKPTPVYSGRFYVQAEEFDTYVNTSGEVLTSMAISDGFSAADTNYGESRQTENSGNGVALNEWEWSKTYNVIWRVREDGATIATYTVNVASADSYEMVLYSINYNSRTIEITVNGIAYYSTCISSSAAYQGTPFGLVTLQEGENTISVAIVGSSTGAIQADYIMFDSGTGPCPFPTPTPIPTIEPTPTPIPVPSTTPCFYEIYVQAEEFDTYVNTSGETLTSVALADGFSASDCDYSEAKQTENSGDGVAINEWSKTYNVIWRARADGATIATYTVTPASDGTYEMILRSRNYNRRTIVITVNGTEYSQSVGQNTSNADYVDISFGLVTLQEGENTISVAIAGSSSGAIQADYIAFVDV